MPPLCIKSHPSRRPRLTALLPACDSSCLFAASSNPKHFVGTAHVRPIWAFMLIIHSRSLHRLLARYSFSVARLHRLAGCHARHCRCRSRPDHSPVTRPLDFGSQGRNNWCRYASEPFPIACLCSIAHLPQFFQPCLAGLGIPYSALGRLWSSRQLMLWRVHADTPRVHAPDAGTFDS